MLNTLCVFFALVLMSAGPLSGQSPYTPGRRALIIGNQKYGRSPLRNSVTDARELSKSLKELGFTSVLLTDAGKPQMLSATRAFADSLAPGDIGFFFYSGHGFQIDSENYLVPVEFVPSSEADARAQAVSVREIKTELERTAAKLVVMVLDSCRDNPFTKPNAANKGLALLEAGLGSYLAFAASPGSIASDNSTGANGLFTKHLLLEMKEPVGVSELFRRVRKGVFDESKGHQLPYLHDQMIADLSLIPQAISPATEQTNGRMEEGKRLYHSGQCEQAVAVFDPLVRVDPKNPFLHNALGLAYACLKMNSPAAESFSMAIALKPAFAAAYLNRGQTFLDSSEYELAREDFTWAIEQEPSTAVFYTKRGRAQLGLLKYELARSDYDRAIQLDPSDSNAYYGRGKALHEIGKDRDALSDYNAAIALRGDLAIYYIDRARARERLGDSAGAAADRRKAPRL